MSFVDSIQTVFRKYAEFNGRAGRPEFWWWVLFYALVVAALSTFTVIPVGDTGDLGSMLASLWAIATLLPTLAVGVRRLRDAGYHWGHLFWLLVPVAGVFIFALYASRPTTNA